MIKISLLRQGFAKEEISEINCHTMDPDPLDEQCRQERYTTQHDDSADKKYDPMLPVPMPDVASETPNSIMESLQAIVYRL